MTEINLGSSSGDSGGDSGGGGGGGKDIVETLEGMRDFVMENPEMAKMFGIDLGEFQDTMTEANQAAEEAGVELDHTFLSDLLEGVETAGYGEMSVSEVKDWVDNNPEMVDNMIEQNL